MTVHSTFKKKQRILLILKDGTQVIARYLDTKSGIIITDNGTFEKKDLRSTNIYKKQKG